MTAIYTLYLISIIFLVLQLRTNHCFFEAKCSSDWSGYTYLWTWTLGIALFASLVIPVTEKNHREIPTHRIEEGSDKYEGVFFAKEEIRLKKVDKFCKRAVMYDNYSFFGVKVDTVYRLEY